MWGDEEFPLVCCQGIEQGVIDRGEEREDVDIGAGGRLRGETGHGVPGTSAQTSETDRREFLGPPGLEVGCGFDFNPDVPWSRRPIDNVGDP